MKRGRKRSCAHGERECHDLKPSVLGAWMSDAALKTASRRCDLKLCTVAAAHCKWRRSLPVKVEVCWLEAQQLYCKKRKAEKQGNKEVAWKVRIYIIVE